LYWRQGVRLAVGVMGLLALLSIWFDDPSRVSTAAGLVTLGRHRPAAGNHRLRRVVHHLPRPLIGLPTVRVATQLGVATASDSSPAVA
jgi:hypothetical protein